MKELRVTLRIRNNLLVQRREELGLNQIEFAEKAGLSLGLYGDMERLRYRPVDDKGEWKPTALTVAEFHGLSPDELWPDAVQTITEPIQTRVFDTGELRHALAASSSRLLTASPEEVMEATETVERINQVVKTLAPREEWLLRQEFGLADQEVAVSRASCAKKLGISDERARQIESKAFRKLQHPSRMKIVDEPLPREPADPMKGLRFGPWTPTEGKHARRRERIAAATSGSVIDWQRVWDEDAQEREKERRESSKRAKEQKRKEDEERFAYELMGIVWLEYAVKPLPTAHAFVAVSRTNAPGDDKDGHYGTVEDDQPSVCGEMIASNDQPIGRWGYPLMVSFLEKCQHCVAALREKLRNQGENPEMLPQPQHQQER